MKILTVSNLYPPDVEGGYERGCEQVVAGLSGRGHKVSVLTSVPRRPARAIDGVNRGLHLSDVFDPTLGEPRSRSTWASLSVSALWLDAGNVRRMLDEIERMQPDVVYLWNTIGIGGLGLVLALEQLGMPWVWHLMDPIPGILAALRGPRFPQLARLFKQPLTGTYISCSQHVIEEIERNGVELAGAVELIPNWVIGPRAAPVHRLERHGPLRILMASVVTRFKGVDVMMKAAATLKERGVHDFLVDVYGPVLDPSLRDTLDELGLGDCFFLKGERPQAELLDLYAQYDLFAFPTWEREAFGFAALEAMSRGCLVLMTNRCGAAEWLVDGVHCLKAERTPEAFAAMIEQVIRGEVDVPGITARARQAVLRDFHLDAIVPRIEAVLMEAAATRRQVGRDPDHVYLTAVLGENLAAAIIDEVTAS